MPPENAGRFSSWRFIIAFVLTVLLAFGAYLGWKIYELRRGEQAVRDLAESLEKWEREQYERAMADTYGGKTPEETLQMYITAVEKGDYELASKYLIENEREEEKESLRLLEEKGNLEKYLNILRNARRTQGDENSVYLEAELDGPNYLVNFLKYPNGIWKIEGI